MIYQKLLKPLLFSADAEKAHEMAVSLASKTQNNRLLQKLTSLTFGSQNSGLEQEFFGCTFPNPVGLAAGFDKNGTTPMAMQALGFGFVEVGSITAKPSSGNPKPRAFRIPADESLINRMGLNNDGADAVIKRLEGLNLAIPLGINIAKTHDPAIQGDEALRDYLYSYKKAQPVADYITVNISCPNTGEGKTFEDPGALRDLLSTLKPEKQKPTLVKFTVDTNHETLKTLVQICEDFDIDGYVATNTSTKRDGLKTSTEVLHKIGNGGLSGKSIQQRSTQVVRWLSEITRAQKPIIGVGGIDSAETALEKLEAGAKLVQIYTGLVYQGPGLVGRIKKGIRSEKIITESEN